MRYVLKIALICLLLAAVVLGIGLVRDRQQLSRGIIRLHVVAQSNSERDQQVKLRVRDAVLRFIGDNMRSMDNAADAYTWLQEHLEAVEVAANEALYDEGVGQTASVSLQEECFARRDYDTFSLPAGVYESLRVTIGDGEGKNWWCVVFPSLCFASEESFADTAAGAGFSQPLTEAVQGEQRQIRFFLLDCLGWLQNWLYKG